MRTMPVVLLLMALGPATASAAPKPPKIPAALDGVDLRDDLVSVSVDKSPKRLGGRDVVVFRQTYRYKLAPEDTEAKGTATDLSVIDPATKDYLVLVRIADRSATGEVAYAPTWKDLNRDRDPELVLTRRKAKGDHAFGPKKRLLQVRHGRMIDTTAELAACPRAQLDSGHLGEDGPVPSAVIELFLRMPTRCSYGEALIAARLELPEQPVPTKSATIAAARPAADCPARAWAERHGRVVAARSTIAFLTAEGRLAVATVTPADETLDVGVVDYEGIQQLDARTVDNHLYLLLEMKERAIVFDPVLVAVVAEGVLKSIRELWSQKFGVAW